MKEFIENKHYYLENGRVVFTALYHLERGTCCKNNCRHCPYEDLNTNKMQIKIKPLRENAKLPIRGSKNAACYDVYANSIQTHPTDPYKVIVKLGFATEIPEGYKGIIVPRSNLTKYNWVLNNSFGVVDSDYRGEWMAIFTKINSAVLKPKELLRDFPYNADERIAQIYFDKVTPVEFIVTDTLDSTERGEGGFGSSGVS